MHLEENKKETEREQSKIGTNIKEDGLMVIASLVVQRLGFDPWVGKIPWRRKWQPTLVLLLGKFNGQRSLVGYSPMGCKELDTTERLHFHFHSGNRGLNISKFKRLLIAAHNSGRRVNDVQCF